MKNPLDATPSILQFSSRTRRWGRIGILVFCGLSVLTVVSAGLFVFWLRMATRAALPQLDGEVHLNGLSAAVTVRRDAHGTPHIAAANEADLFLAQGYVTAQDRLWQMDTLRRAANGELAEISGPAMIEHDKMQRVLQIRRTAERIYANLPAPDRFAIDQYARGVNLFIQSHPLTLPPEFRLLRYTPRPWTGVDTISVGLSMVQGLDSHFEAKLSRAHIAAKLNNPRLEADLYPVGSWRDHPPTGILLDLSQPHPEPASTPNSDEDEDDDRNQARLHGPGSALSGPGEDPARLRALEGLPTCEGCAAGSNNWVVAGSRTASGRPLLSNDMHLALMTPNVWHMVELSAPGLHVAGVTMPGVPGVLEGHNDHIAWGITALYSDVQDLYVHQLDGKGNFRTMRGEWKPLAIDHEVIRVRGGKNVSVDVQLTDLGPLLNPVFSKETRPISLHWTIYDSTLNSLPIYELDHASSWSDFTAAISAWSFPTLNLVYADDQNHIGYHAIGRVPLRPAGPCDYPCDRSAQWMDSRYYAQGYIPFDKMPNAFDPPSGFLATANSRVTPDGSPYELTHNWIEPYRTERIYKQLQGRTQLTPADMLAVQTDIYSEADQELGQRLAYAIDHAENADMRLRQAADLLRSWDGRLATDSAAASIVTQTRGALWSLLLEPRLGKELAGTYNWAAKNFAEDEIVMRARPEWLPQGFKNWDQLLAAAVRKAIDEGKAPANLTRWNYGNWHVIELQHPIGAKLPLLGRITDTGPLPLSGDTTTVKQVGRSFGPSQRFTMDWSNVDGSTENIVLGESGNPLSPYYRDQWEDYYNGRTFALPFSPGAVAAQTRHTLQLLP
jgi:penicillin amidase